MRKAGLTVYSFFKIANLGNQSVLDKTQGRLWEKLEQLEKTFLASKLTEPVVTKFTVVWPKDSLVSNVTSGKWLLKFFFMGGDLAKRLLGDS